jgi:very-short-patch-repair endonuclease
MQGPDSPDRAASRSDAQVKDALLRRLARDHWVRLHGTPRVTVIVGSPVLWQRWSELAGLDTTLAGTFRDAIALAVAEPTRDVAVATTRKELERWRSTAPDRERAMVDEGLLVVEAPAYNPDARSAAEAALFDALEATPATAGKFELNGRLSVRFGPDACEVDLLARTDGIAIEIDGVHHFGDLERYRRDRRKDVLLQSRGLFVIRLLAEDVMRDPRIGVAVVCQALAAKHDATR